jgi:formylglycine-generating enzyme required for sulfatase activity
LKTSPIQEELRRIEKPIHQPLPLLNSLQKQVVHSSFISEIERLEDQAIIPPFRKVIPPNLLDEPIQFPKLTEEEIAITKKKKKAMLKAFTKHDKDAYAYIPSGTFDYNGKQVSVQAFYMGIGEVTNFEYRTFLFDLLIQGRNQEFLKAKPDQTQWKNKEGLPFQPFTDYYFSHPAYNDYPVVNVSREGAELYCLWLSKEVSKYVGDEKQGQFNDVRIPLRVEWVKAASNEGKQLPYPWVGPYTRNSKGLIQANFIWGQYDPVLDSINKKNNTTSNSDILAPSKSFWPSELGLYNMSGNAAEMVYEDVNRVEPGTAGGSWQNNAEEIKIYAPDPNKEVIDPRPTIGFRVVSTFLILKKE